jgi:hypothetical protein
VASSTQRLEKWKRNQIFEAIQVAGLDPKEFDLEDHDSGVRIKHKWSESCFFVGGDPGHYAGRRVVGDGPDWPYDVYSWEALMSRVGTWLQQVKQDLETPDLWAGLQQEAKLLEAGFDEVTENTPFTPDEQNDIARRLQELAEHARDRYSLSEAQMQVIHARLDYIVEAAGRFGRRDAEQNRLTWDTRNG